MVKIPAVCVLVACGSTPPSPPAAEWSDFYGIQYQAPPGTDARITRSVLPGPGGGGGSPTDERPYVTLSAAGFYVTITKTQERSTFDTTKQVYLANQVGTDHTGVTTATGWEMRYRMPRSDDPTKTSGVHLVYAELGGGNYECSYGEQSSRDLAAAEAICRSMRVKP